MPHQRPASDARAVSASGCSGSSKVWGPGAPSSCCVSHARVGDHARFSYTAAFVVPWKDHMVARLAEAGVPARSIGRGRRGGLGWPWRVLALVRSGEFDVVHAHSPLLAVPARLSARTVPRSRRPAVVSTEHNVWERYSPVTRWLNAVTCGLDQHRWAVSRRVVSLHARKGRCRDLRAGARCGPGRPPTRAGRARSDSCRAGDRAGRDGAHHRGEPARPEGLPDPAQSRADRARPDQPGHVPRSRAGAAPGCDRAAAPGAGARRAIPAAGLPSRRPGDPRRGRTRSSSPRSTRGTRSP